MNSFAGFSVTEGSLKSGNVQWLTKLLTSENEWVPWEWVGEMEGGDYVKLYIVERKEKKLSLGTAKNE